MTPRASTWNWCFAVMLMMLLGLVGTLIALTVVVLKDVKRLHIAAVSVNSSSLLNVTAPTESTLHAWTCESTFMSEAAAIVLTGVMVFTLGQGQQERSSSRLPSSRRATTERERRLRHRLRRRLRRHVRRRKFQWFDALGCMLISISVLLPAGSLRVGDLSDLR